MNPKLINYVQEMFPDIAHLYDAEDPQEWIDASMQAILETQHAQFEYLYDELDSYSQRKHTYTFALEVLPELSWTFDIVHTPAGYLSKAFHEYACDKLEELIGDERYTAEKMVLQETDVPCSFSVHIKTDDELCWEMAEGVGKTLAGHQGAVDDAQEEMNWEMAEEFGKFIAGSV